MHYLISFICTITLISNMTISGMIGKWFGIINVQGQQLKIEVEVRKDDGHLSSVINSPDQGISGIPVASTVLVGDTLSLDITSIQATYQGIVQTDSIIGIWAQSGIEVPLNLRKEK